MSGKAAGRMGKSGFENTSAIKLAFLNELMSTEWMEMFDCLRVENMSIKR